MIALAFCILASTIISMVFKLFQAYEVRNLPAIVINYFVCVICGSLFQGEFLLSTDILSEPWIGLTFLFGILFIGGFNINAMSVQKAGIAVTSTLQRISLLLSVSFAIIFLGQNITLLKGLGILLGVLAVFLIVDLNTSKEERKNLILPLSVFALAGTIEIMLTLAQEWYNVNKNTTFTVTMFFLAGLFGLIFISIRSVLKKTPLFSAKEIIGGIALGIPNFFSIHLILVALGDLDAVVVFPVLSIGTIVLSTIAAVVFFKEVLSKKQLVGLGIAASAIILITGLVA